MTITWRDGSGLRRTLEHRGFRRLFVAQTVSRWGDTFNAVALVVVVFSLTGSGVKVSGVVAMEILPVLLFGLAAGALVDRVPRVRAMIVADLGRASLAGVLVAVPDRLGVLYACAFGLAALSVVFNPASASVVPALVDDGELVSANSLLWSAAVLSQIVLAPLAGGVVGWWGARVAFGINAASFVFSAATLRRLDAGADVPVGGDRPWNAMTAGVRIVRRSRFLGTLAGVQLLAALSAGATSALLVVLAQRHLRVSSSGYGLLLGAIGVGAGIGTLVLPRVVSDVRRPALLFGPYLVRAGVDLVLATVSSFPIALAALAGYGMATSTGAVTYGSALQIVVPDRFRGRVFAVYDVIWQAARLASIAIGGVLADRIGIRAVYGFGGALLVVAGALGFAGAPTRVMHDTID